MNRTIALATLAALALSVACASAPRLPPKDGPEDVRLFDPQAGNYPDPGYRTIGPVKVEMPLGTPNPELIMELRAAAARLGADAVILQRIRRTFEGEAGVRMDRDEHIIAEGLAVYYPRPASD